MQYYVVLYVSNSEKRLADSPTALTQLCANGVPWTLTVSWDGSICRVWRSSSSPQLWKPPQRSPEIVVKLTELEIFQLHPQGKLNPPNPPPRPTDLAEGIETDQGYQFTLPVA